MSDQVQPLLLGIERHLLNKPRRGQAIKEYFEEMKNTFHPDLIFTHYRGDLHQDHRLISELTWDTFRNHLILEYEIPKYDGDFGSPNFLVHLKEETCREKVGALLRWFGSQSDKHWFSQETFFSRPSDTWHGVRGPAGICRRILFPKICHSMKALQQFDHEADPRARQDAGLPILLYALGSDTMNWSPNFRNSRINSLQ